MFNLFNKTTDGQLVTQSSFLVLKLPSQHFSTGLQIHSIVNISTFKYLYAPRQRDDTNAWMMLNINMHCLHYHNFNVIFFDRTHQGLLLGLWINIGDLNFKYVNMQITVLIHSVVRFKNILGQNVPCPDKLYFT